MKEKRIETIAELENALEEIESGEGLSTFVEGHGLHSHRFHFEWREPLLHISYDLPTGRVLSPEEDQKADDAEAGAAIRLAIVLLRDLSSLAQRLGEDSEQYKAAVQRLDEAIDHARNLAKDGKVYNEADWENHDTQRKIATPNLANKERKLDTYGANISEKTLEAMTNNGRYVSYSNSFFRDFYDVLIKGSPHENWFA